MTMNQGPRGQVFSKLGILIGIIALGLVFPGDKASGQATGGEKKPKVILLGFDGVDFKLARRFIDEGHLPHLEALDRQGTFLPLKTSNPAQSPVAWASIVSGTNPGKTNIPGFIRRNFQGGGILPQLATVEESYHRVKHTIPYSQITWLNRDSRGILLVLFGGGFFLVSLIILLVLLRLNLVISLAGSVILGGAAIFFGVRFFNELPETVPFPYNLQQGEYFWNILSREKVRTIGLYAPGAYPVVAEQRADILGGLGVPDINGGTGTWYVYSSEAFTFFDMRTNTGGKVIRLNEEGDGRLKGKVYGPTNFFQMERFEKQIEALKHRKEDAKLTESERTAAVAQYATADREFKSWKDEDNRKKATLDLTIEPDFEARTIRVEIQNQTQTVSEGKWSDWFKLQFKLSPFLKVPALLRLRLIRCADDEVRFFVPALDINPQAPPPYLRISSPAGYSAALADRLRGPFETVGWACITHGLKDEEIDEVVFMEDIEFTLKSKRRLLKNQLNRKDWDVLFEVFYTPDRVQHMMYRVFDENHPQHDPGLAERTMTFFDREIRLKDSIIEIYKVVDSVVGEVMDRIEEGEFGDDATLMIVSDHGFAPFYYGVGLNNLLIEHGFMALKPDTSGEPKTVKSMVASGTDNYLLFADWSKSRAYSLGLGKIYINLKGREPSGIVDPADYDAVREEIIRDLEAYRDPSSGDRVIRRVYKREEIFSGGFWKEGDVDFRFYGIDGGEIKEHRYTEGFADLYLGFEPKYRVSWQTSLGGLEETAIVPNKQKWSGDHVSVDPSAVTGILFCNRKLKVAAPPSLVDIVPTILVIYGIKPQDNLDGEPFMLDL